MLGKYSSTGHDTTECFFENLSLKSFPSILGAIIVVFIVCCVFVVTDILITHLLDTKS